MNTKLLLETVRRQKCRNNIYNIKLEVIMLSYSHQRVNLLIMR